MVFASNPIKQNDTNCGVTQDLPVSDIPPHCYLVQTREEAKTEMATTSSLIPDANNLASDGWAACKG